jgi:class 3 adenylate cyclase
MPPLLRGSGRRTKRLAAYLRARERTPRRDRPALDQSRGAALAERGAVVFTDTADFTVRTRRHGILHFLMAFSRALVGLRTAVRAARGTVVKVEGDSMILCFVDASAACRGVLALEAALRLYNRGRPASERFRFSYGIGYGELLRLEEDVFGLEVNLASKLGEDLAGPGEALLTPAAAAALGPDERRSLVPYKVVSFKGASVEVHALRLRGSRA